MESPVYKHTNIVQAVKYAIVQISEWKGYIDTKRFFFVIEYCSLDLANILSNRNNLKSCGFNNNFLHLEECYEVHEVPPLVS